jgi:NAD(P)-dependent dehydrogenase (short-subunit alcohol dehydrogenase family)
LAAKHGAKLVLGDLSVKGVNEVIADVRRAGGQGIARQCNVTSWESQRDLFEAGEREFGAIDIVVPNAGVTEKLHPGFEDDVFDKQGRLSPPNTITLDVNLRGVVFTTHLAMHYLRKRPDRKGKALVLIGSMASWFAIPSGPMYSAAKHGVLGLARSEFNTLHAHGIQTALICPWFTCVALALLTCSRSLDPRSDTGVRLGADRNSLRLIWAHRLSSRSRGWRSLACRCRTCRM